MKAYHPHAVILVTPVITAIGQMTGVTGIQNKKKEETTDD